MRLKDTLQTRETIVNIRKESYLVIVFYRCSSPPPMLDSYTQDGCPKDSPPIVEQELKMTEYHTLAFHGAW